MRRPTSRLVLGDWHPLLRDPIDLLRAAFLVGATVLLIQGTVGGAVRLVLTMALVLVPRIFNLTQGAPAAQSAVEPPILGSLCAARSDSAAPDLISEEPP